VGKIYDYAEREGYRGDAAYGFRFVPKGTESINIHTRILLPDRGLGGGTYRVVYLQDDTRRLKHEAVDIAILSGKRTGFHASMDAAPFGSGLAIPAGIAFVGFGTFGLRYRKDDARVRDGSNDFWPSTGGGSVQSCPSPIASLPAAPNVRYPATEFDTPIATHVGGPRAAFKKG
jgi:hypothetical protein